MEISSAFPALPMFDSICGPELPDACPNTPTIVDRARTLRPRKRTIELMASSLELPVARLPSDSLHPSAKVGYFPNLDSHHHTKHTIDIVSTVTERYVRARKHVSPTRPSFSRRKPRKSLVKQPSQSLAASAHATIESSTRKCLMHTSHMPSPFTPGLFGSGTNSIEDPPAPLLPLKPSSLLKNGIVPCKLFLPLL